MDIKEIREKYRRDKWRAIEDSFDGDPALGRGHGRLVVDALRDFYSIYSDEVFEWFSSLYDPTVGAFYYSPSARDNDTVTDRRGRTFPLLPDAESTCQAFAFARGSGMMEGVEKPIEFFPRELLDRFTAFVRGMQRENGYFYHPQWGDAIDKQLNRRARDLVWCGKYLEAVGAVPVYDTPSGIKGEKSALAVAKEEKPKAVVATPEHLLSKEAFLSYLGTLDMANRSYHHGNELITQLSQITARDKVLSEQGADYRLLDIVVDWLTEQINPATGHWHAEANYYGVNGLLKTLSFFNTKGVLYPCALRAAKSAACAIVSPEPMTGIVDIYNAWWVFGNLSYNLRHFGGEEGNAIAESLKTEVRASAPALIRRSAEKLLPFRKAGGSFSYCPDMSSPTSQDMPVAIYGTPEGDINATGIGHNGARKHIFNCLGIGELTPPLFVKEDGVKFVGMLEERLKNG